MWVARKGRMALSPVIDDLLEQERQLGIHSMEAMNTFAMNVQNNRQELLWLLRRLKHEGKRIAGVSAPAKGMTLLNYCRIGPETLDFVTEKSKMKIGRYTPGAHIPVVTDETLLEHVPEYALLLAWNFAEEIMDNLRSYREKGGRFIIPIPKPHVVQDDAPRAFYPSRRRINA